MLHWQLKFSNTNQFTCKNSEGHTIPAIPDELRKGFNRKRIDHRHHALDAIVIACATRNHVHLLNNEAAKSENKKIRHQLSRKLRRYEKVLINGEEREVAKEFLKPWPTFTQDVKKALDSIIVSFKQNLRIINKATNRYLSYYDENRKLRVDKSGCPYKDYKAQKSDESWAIRKPLHKDTVFAKVALRKVKPVRLNIALQNVDNIADKELRNEIKRLLVLGYDEKQIKKFFTDGDNKDIWAEFNPNKINVYYFTDDTYAVRKPLDDSFDKKKIREQITDTGIQQILHKHLEENDNDPKVAFSPEGIERMNANLIRLNNGKKHKPIYKVRWYESASKFAVGTTGNKKDKYVEAAKGTNLYFAVYINKNGMRSFDTIPLNEVIERLKNRLSPVPETNKNGDTLLFFLSPNDFVYLPTKEEVINKQLSGSINGERIYKAVSSYGPQCFFINSMVAVSIVNKVEYSPLNKMERAITGEMIKEICIPIKVDRLGNIVYIGTEFLPKII